MIICIDDITLTDLSGTWKIAAMEITVLPAGRAIRVERGANLLHTLLAHQVPVSYSCQSGRCGTCLCRVRQGGVVEAGAAVRGGDAQSAERLVRACVTELVEPCVIEIAEPDEVVVQPARLVKAVVCGLEDLTHDVRLLRLQAARPMAFSPGQYARLQFAAGHERPYSMAGLADDPQMEFHVRRVPGGRVSGYIGETLKLGDSVKLSGPLGAAYLRRKHGGPMLCVAGGTGLAPILSLVRGAIAAGMRNPIELYFGVRSVRDLYGLPWLAALQKEHPALRVHTVLASGVGSGCRSGTVPQAIAADHQDLTGHRAYLCGSPGLVEATSPLLERLGVLPGHIHRDAFYPAAH